MEEGYGKARRGRRQRAGPYSRPSKPPAPVPEEEEARELAQLAAGEPERQGLLASLLQRGASLITRVRLFERPGGCTLPQRPVDEFCNCGDPVNQI